MAKKMGTSKSSQAKRLDTKDKLIILTHELPSLVTRIKLDQYMLSEKHPSKDSPSSRPVADLLKEIHQLANSIQALAHIHHVCLPITDVIKQLPRNVLIQETKKIREIQNQLHLQVYGPLPEGQEPHYRIITDHELAVLRKELARHAEKLEEKTKELHETLGRSSDSLPFMQNASSLVQNSKNIGLVIKAIGPMRKRRFDLGEVLRDLDFISVKTEGQHFIKGKRPRVFLAFYNMIKNAQQNSDLEPEQQKIWADIRQEGNNHVVRVTDNARGIPADMWESVFRPGESMRGGTGVGLALVRHIVTNEQGGNVEIESSGEKMGTTFRLELPKENTKRPRKTRNNFLTRERA